MRHPPAGDSFIPAHEVAEPAHEIHDPFPDPGELRHRRIWPPADSDSDEEEVQQSYRRMLRKDKGKQPMRLLDTKPEVGSSSSIKRRHSWNDAYGRHPESNPPTPKSLPLAPGQQEFTFRAQLPPRNEESAAKEQSATDVVPETWKMDFSSWNPLSNPPQLQSSTASATLKNAALRYTSEKSPGRPPLYSTAFFTPAEPTSPAQILAQSSSRHTTPLASPSLAIYRAPEELEAGPSKPTGYFPTQPAEMRSEHEEPAEEDPITEWQMYFREPDAEDTVDDHADEPIVPVDVEEDRDADIEMPGLQLWTDEDEMDEEEDGPEDVVEFEGPGDVPVEEAPAGNFAEMPEIPVEEAQGAEPVDVNEEMEAGMEDDMEGALEGE